MTVPSHCETDCAFGVIPVKINAGEFGPGPIGSDGVVFLEGRQQVVSVASVDILDAKVVDDESQKDGLPTVAPEAWSGETLVVSMLVES